MLRQALEVQHLGPCACQVQQQPAFAASRCAAHDSQLETSWQLEQVPHDLAPVGLVAAFELQGAPADAGEHVSQRSAALATTPAINERFPVTWFCFKLRFNDRRDVARDQHSAAAACVEGGDLLVQRSDLCSLAIVQYGPVDRTRQVILGKLLLASHVDQLVETGWLLQCLGARDNGAFGRQRLPLTCSRGCRYFHTLSSITGCALTVG
jgi:hypothetical protein